MSVSYELTVLILGISFTAQFVANWATKRRGKKVEEKKEAEVGERKKERRRRGGGGGREKGKKTSKSREEMNKTRWN